jgi:hypothetical protein
MSDPAHTDKDQEKESDPHILTDPAASGRRRRKDRRLDTIQLSLIFGFTVAFFLVAYASKSGIILYGSLSTLVFLGLAASITLYYFLDTVAEWHQKNYSMAGAGALFLIVMGFGSQVIDKDTGAAIDERDQQIRALQNDLALKTPDVTIDGQVLDPSGQSVDGKQKNLAIGVLIDGDFYSGRSGEHRFRISNLPRLEHYTIVVSNLISWKSYPTTRIFTESEVDEAKAILSTDAVYPEGMASTR